MHKTWEMVQKTTNYTQVISLLLNWSVDICISKKSRKSWFKEHTLLKIHCKPTFKVKFRFSNRKAWFKFLKNFYGNPYFLLQPSNPKCFIVSPVKLKIELAWPNTTLHSLYFCHKVHKMYFSKICGLKPTFIQHCFPFPIASQGK